MTETTNTPTGDVVIISGVQCADHADGVAKAKDYASDPDYFKDLAFRAELDSHPVTEEQPAGTHTCTFENITAEVLA